MVAAGNFNQYIPDSMIEAKDIDEIRKTVEVSKNGPFPKGDPVFDLKLSGIENIPANIKFVSNTENKRKSF